MSDRVRASAVITINARPSSAPAALAHFIAPLEVDKHDRRLGGHDYRRHLTKRPADSRHAPSFECLGDTLSNRLSGIDDGDRRPMRRHARGTTRNVAADPALQLRLASTVEASVTAGPLAATELIADRDRLSASAGSHPPSASSIFSTLGGLARCTSNPASRDFATSSGVA